MEKEEFENKLNNYLNDTLVKCVHVDDKNKDWTIKGFVNHKNHIYTISSDTKVLSKIMELHLLPEIKGFASKNGFELILADHQNYYPDMSFLKKDKKSSQKNCLFALDFKTTYRTKCNECNGFTLGSHGGYFKERNKKKNIQFPYDNYNAHFCLGIIYSRVKDIDEIKKYVVADASNSNSSDSEDLNRVQNISEIKSVITDLQFFVAEKWKIASDKSGSGNTANIGSIKKITELTDGKSHIFANESDFNNYWLNYGNEFEMPDENNNLVMTKIKNKAIYDKYVKYLASNVVKGC